MSWSTLSLLLSLASTPDDAVPPTSQEEPMITIKETTQSELGSTRVGVGNIWERSYTLPDGTEKKGITAMLFFDDETKQVVGPGTVVTRPDGRWKVVEVSEAPAGERLGKVVLEPLTAAE